MRKHILTIILLIALACSLLRLSIAGWFFIVGVLSIIIFGTLHIILHFQVIKYSETLKRTDMALVGLSHVLFVNLFLFQSDGGDDRGYILIEYLFGKFPFELEQYASSIFTISLVLYLVTIIVLFARLRIINPAFSKKKLKVVILVMLAVIILPVGLIYLLGKSRDLKEMKAEEKTGKYEILKRALRNKENATYLRLYKHPNSYTSIPAGVFELYNLEELELYSNAIKSIPREIGLLKKLRILDLQYNQLQFIPPEIGQLRSLEKLSLMNNFIDSLDPAICDCVNLKELQVSGHSLRVLPACLANLKTLERLVIQTDSVDRIMESLGQLSQLKKLSLFNYGSPDRDMKKYAELKLMLPGTEIDP